MNNALFPWVILVPRVDAAREVIDLDDAGRHALMDEIALVSSAMQTLFTPDKLNIAALGNMVPQLHVHIIARFIRDTAWPNPVWGKGSEPYAEPQPVVLRLRETLRLTWKSD
jgi:diadenosine tetraphosphate (Ap4A) HIT family hydrolase